MKELYIGKQKMIEFPKDKNKEAHRAFIEARMDYPSECIRLLEIINLPRGERHTLQCVFSFEHNEKVRKEIEAERCIEQKVNADDCIEKN